MLFKQQTKQQLLECRLIKMPPKDFEDQSQEYEQRKIKLYPDYISLKSIPHIKPKRNIEDFNLLQVVSQQKYRQFVEQKSKNRNTRPLSTQSQEQLQQMKEFIQLKHNVCVFGAGSKISLLKEVTRSQLSDSNIWQVKGYLSSITLKKIFNHFGEFLIKAGLTKKITAISAKDQLNQYNHILQNSPNAKLVVIFHSIDGPNLLSAQVQKLLSQLFSLPHIQLIASLDNMKIVMNWSPITIEKYKFLFFKIETLNDYCLQQKHRPQDIEKKEKSEQALSYIWLSLNSNQKEILKFIAKNELQNLNRAEQSNYTAGQLFDICVDEIILSEDSQLRQNLLELLDHKVIFQKFDEKKNKKVYVIKYDRTLLEKIVSGTIGA